jgi:hypothetical protein
MAASDRDTSFAAWVVAVLTEAYRRSEDSETKIAWVARLVIALGLAVVPNAVAELTRVDVPPVLRVAPVLAYLMLYAPYEVWRKERVKLTRMQENAEARFTVAADVRSYGKDRKRVASLRVTNSGSDQIKNCTGRLVSVTAIKGDNRKTNASVAMYLGWSVGDGGGKFMTFQSEALLDVAVMEKPYRGKTFIYGVPDGRGVNLNTMLKEPNSYILRIEVAAENSARVVADYLYSVEPMGQFAQDDGMGGQTDVALPTPQFRRIS